MREEVSWHRSSSELEIEVILEVPIRQSILFQQDKQTHTTSFQWGANVY